MAEAFAGPHDWFNDKMGAYDSAGKGTNNMFGGEAMAIVNVGLAAPFAAANGITYYMGPNAMSIATGNFK